MIVDLSEQSKEQVVDLLVQVADAIAETYASVEGSQTAVEEMVLSHYDTLTKLHLLREVVDHLIEEEENSQDWAIDDAY